MNILHDALVEFFDYGSGPQAHVDLSGPAVIARPLVVSATEDVDSPMGKRHVTVGVSLLYSHDGGDGFAPGAKLGAPKVGSFRVAVYG